MVRSFNQLALMVPTEILAEATPQARAKVIAAYIRVSEFGWVKNRHSSAGGVARGVVFLLVNE